MIGFQIDVKDPAAFDAFAARVRAKIPELNVLVNNAGVSRPESLTAEALQPLILLRTLEAT